ncbi:MAG: FKBP-type peptidyl-prolyl cis-trans isomerase [Phocaeicola sp.]|uniref:FKBP-type peptidyl-prolyl cis-trans isomerase n=1 Tax=Phocaeicola TaxID=909656 RepID=UPI00234E75A1|nr:FKBP-type peptidyl-prolyl cis-trans isomerase [Phocaeicola oris]MCE2617463.1 FKBP-type peptidyl-prolyl cis-trans isomerase [Phocaeicola oris]
MENKYISVTYRLYVMKNSKKTLVEEATKERPFRFISGMGTTLEKFENALTILNTGDPFAITIPCADAYGEYIPEGIRTVPKDMFEIDGKFDEDHIYEGAMVPLQDNEGHRFYSTITKVEPDQVTVDLNHPFAGKDLTFEGEVTELRDATKEEIQQMVEAMSQSCDGGGCENCGSNCGNCGGGCSK